MRALAKDNLSLLIQALREEGYEVLGPRMGEGGAGSPGDRAVEARPGGRGEGDGAKD